MIRSVSQSSFESQDSREDLDDQKFHRFHEAVHHHTVETLPEVDEERDLTSDVQADDECCKNGTPEYTIYDNRSTAADLAGFPYFSFCTYGF